MIVDGIGNLTDHPELIPVAARSIWGTWGSESFDTTVNSLRDPSRCPRTLIAFADCRPAGVAGFARYQSPDQAADALWINSMFVQVEARGHGVGSALLAAAASSAGELVDELFVRTDLPDWYLQRGWRSVETGEALTILRLRL